MAEHMVVCGAGSEVVQVDYSEPGHPRNVHADGSLCDHIGGVSIEKQPAEPDLQPPGAGND